MREYEMEVLEKYELEVNSTRRIEEVHLLRYKRRDDASERDKDLGGASLYCILF